MEPEQKSNGALIGLIIIVIILIIGGIYFWKNSMQKETMPENSTSTTNLDADVNNLDLDSLDSEI